MSDVIEIPLSRNKLFLVLIGALIFVIVCLPFVLNPETFTSSRRGSPVPMQIICIVGVLLFGLCAGFAAKKMFDKEAGLKIDQNGIYDNSSGISFGLIKWEDIIRIGSTQAASTKILLIMIDKPEKFIDRVPNVMTRQVMKASLKMYGTPLAITSTSLKISFQDLEKLIRNEFKRRKRRNRKI